MTLTIDVVDVDQHEDGATIYYDLRVGDLLISTEQTASPAEFSILEQLTDVEIVSGTPLYRTDHSVAGPH